MEGDSAPKCGRQREALVLPVHGHSTRPIVHVTTTIGNQVRLDQTADDACMDDASNDTPDPDNLDAYNADGTIARPPDDIDLDT